MKNTSVGAGDSSLGPWEELAGHLDVSYSYQLARRMERHKTNDALGYRTAGSRAEFLTGELLAEEMRRIGLEVSKDQFSLDGWDFKKARLYYSTPEGPEIMAELGGYQTEFHTTGRQQFTVINAGRGTARELSRLDLTGKLALIRINQRDEWWINYPAYQAHLHGAAAVLAVQYNGYGEVNSRSLNAQDICGPADAPAFSISRKDAKKLTDVLELSFGETAQVWLDAESTVTPGATSYNIIGTIPGQDPDSLVLMSAHYDSYFHGFQDDNTAISMMLGIARAVKQSGYRPQKTLVFCAMAAEEWGACNTRYDWSTGAWNQIFRVHPEWAGRAVADINLELPAYTHGKRHQIRCCYEYKTWFRELIKTLPQELVGIYPKGIGVVCPTQTWSDDFSMSIAGVPSLVNEFGDGLFMETHYHSQFDNNHAYDEKAYYFHHMLYSRILLAFDAVSVAPLDFSNRLWDLSDSLSTLALDPYLEGSFHQMAENAAATAEKLYAHLEKINSQYQAVLAKTPDKAPRLLAKNQALNRRLLELFKYCEDHFVRLTWHDEPIFPHEGAQSNLEGLHKAAWQLAAGACQDALDTLSEIDNNRYAAFDREVYRYFTDYVLEQPAQRLYWGAGRVRGHLDLFDLIRGLEDKMDANCSDFSPEIAQLGRLEHQELERLRATLLEEISHLAGLEHRLHGLLG